MTSSKKLSSKEVLHAVNQISTWAEERITPSSSEAQKIFSTLFLYVQKVVQSKEFQDKEIRQAIRSLLILSLEAVELLERFLGKGTIRSLKEVQDLQSLYQHKVQPLFVKEEEMKISIAAKTDEKHLLAGLKAVREDDRYEFFLIRKEDGSSPISPSLKIHLELLNAIYHLFPEEDSLMTKAKLAYDHVCHQIGQTILKEKMALIDSFYKEALKFKNQELVKAVNKALMALMLTANARNLSSNTNGKSCQHYYHDFHLHLRHACAIASKKKESRTENFLHTVLQLVTEFVFSFFLQPIPRGQIAAFLWQHPFKYKDIEKQDQNLRIQLRTEGPLFKAVLAIKSKASGFDPLMQGALPGELYRFNLESLDISVLQLPSPTYQEDTRSAAVVPEFSYWVELMQQKGKVHLLINLQDRILKEERSRAVCLEKQDGKESLITLSLDRHSSFYEQNGPYLEWEDPNEFFKLCQDQMFSESTGFYIPSSLSMLKPFVLQACQLIHATFFGKKERLTQKNRCDFIEILYLLFVLKAAEVLKVDSLSFTDKDGVDDATVMNVALFTLLHLWKEGLKLSKDEQEQFLELLYTPALYIRERLPRLAPFNRLSSALEVMAEVTSWDRLCSLFSPPCSPQCAA